MDTYKVIKFIRYLINATMLILLILQIMNVFDALSNEQAYHFGINEYIQPYSWMYKSKVNYVIAGIISIIYLTTILVTGWFKKYTIYFVMTGIYVLFIIYSQIIID
jgi:hypothetical protein